MQLIPEVLDGYRLRVRLRRHGFIAADLIKVVGNNDVSAEAKKRAANRRRNTRTARSIIVLAFCGLIRLKNNLSRPMLLVPRTKE